MTSFSQKKFLSLFFTLILIAIAVTFYDAGSRENSAAQATFSRRGPAHYQFCGGIHRPQDLIRLSCLYLERENQGSRYIFCGVFAWARCLLKRLRFWHDSVRKASLQSLRGQGLHAAPFGQFMSIPARKMAPGVTMVRPYSTAILTILSGKARLRAYFRH